MEENEDEEGQEEDTPRGGRTPASSGKKWYLANLFATPTTLRYAAMVEDEEERKGPAVNNQPAAAAAAAAASPGNKGAAAGQGETPSFLRRSNAGRSFKALDTSTAGLSPIAARKPPQFVGKGLSALVQGLRDMEEEKLDDDMDVLRELEAEQEAGTNQNQDVDGVDVADSQNQTGNAGRRPYKKKGQKRTTRRVHMKPVVVSKPQTQTQAGPAGSDGSYDEELDDDELAAAVPDTQLPETVNQVPEADDNDRDHDNASLHTMSDTEPDDSDPDYDQPVPKTKSFSEKMKEAISADSSSKNTDSPSTEKPDPKTKTKTKAKKQEEEKPRARKVNPNANAHANFRSLKIGRGRGRGGAGRFRRR